MKKQGSNGNRGRARTGWRWLAGTFVCLLATYAQAQVHNDAVLKRCGTVEYEQRVLQRRNPNRVRQINELNRLLQQAETEKSSLRRAADETVFRIPVVVHVVHSSASGTIGGTNNPNISEEQIASQIQVLNEDYRRKEGTPGFNIDPIGADARIEFFLATTDPNGQPTNGITRHYYTRQTEFDVFADDVLLSEIAYWPSDRYLNIWVAPLKDNYLGYGQFPSTADTLKGLLFEQNEFIDGVIIDYRYFGRQTGAVRSSTYCCGRTTTHEVGHWMGLIHTWGDGDGCGEDYVADTPLTKSPNQTTQCRQTYSTCLNGQRTRDLTENFMDYSPDACMNLFTQGQVNRMRAVLQLSPRRRKVIQSVEALPETETLTITVYPNPAQDEPTVDVQLKGFQSFSVELIDMTGRPIKTIAYTDAPSTRVTVPTRGLPTGVYVVRVSTDHEKTSQRLLVR